MNILKGNIYIHMREARVANYSSNRRSTHYGVIGFRERDFFGLEDDSVSMRKNQNSVNATDIEDL